LEESQCQLNSTQIKITHTFNAPRELVFKALTKSEHLMNWWGPKGWTFEVAKSDFRPGGVFHYSQRPADGNVMYVKFLYSEIIAPEKIVYTSFFSVKKVTLYVHRLTKIGLWKP
jgi:uncharacterized protein YndB with AHSA1/START domain